MVDIFDPTQEQIISLTPSAIAHFKKSIAKENSIGVFIGIKKTGCSGLAYDVQVVADEPKNFTLVEQEGIKFFIENKAIAFISGTTVDYVLQGFGISKLVYYNPHEKNRCGCGESFTVEE